ncbi:nicotinate phosphoribosyltransferase [Pseudonaja textilis]|uniref:nicotinate phosphoribosyltransferase n=1 Tax=Pseudonaja textilis TaxID=8673 RepID=UPI000EA91CB2|nr:nicotinate phosphoribosyltransferase [Pseudonaja textilis]
MEARRGSSLALLTDLYQFTMAYGYWRAGRHRQPAAFELFFRRCPFQGAFALGAGLGDCLAFLRSFRFSRAGFPCMDLMALEEESAPEAGQEVEYWSLGGTEKAGKVIPSAVEILHLVYFKDGQVCRSLPTLLDIKAHAQTSLDKLNPVHKRLQDPEAYQVAVTRKLYLLLLDLQKDS